MGLRFSTIAIDISQKKKNQIRFDYGQKAFKLFLHNNVFHSSRFSCTPTGENDIFGRAVFLSIEDKF